MTDGVQASLSVSLQVRGALGREWGSVCPLLQQLLQRTDSPGAVKARVLRCLSSWVLLDVPLSESESLLHDCFGVLRDPELFDTAMEAIVNALSQPDSQRCVEVLGGGVLSFVAGDGGRMRDG